MQNASPLKTTDFKLARLNNNAALRISAFGMGFNLRVLPERDMNQSTFISTHRRQGHGAILLEGTVGSRDSHRNNLIVPTALVSFNINNNGIPESELPAHK